MQCFAGKAIKNHILLAWVFYLLSGCALLENDSAPSATSSLQLPPYNATLSVSPSTDNGEAQPLGSAQITGAKSPTVTTHLNSPAPSELVFSEKPAALSIAGLKNNISLELRETGLRDALMLLSQSADLNFILDQDVPADTTVTIFVTEANVADVLEFILQTQSLEKKVLNSQTVLIYPATDEKKARYADLYTKSFPISHAEPSKVADLLRGMVKPNELFVDEASRSLIIRDTPQVLEASERLIRLHDTPPAEVLLDVEIMEVSSDKLTNLGVEYPSSLSLSVQGAAGVAGSLRWSELGDLNGDSYTLGVGDPLAVLNLRNTLGSANILAKPQIRVKNLEQASVLIGDKVPVITSTLNQTSGFESQSVTYLDVGVKLEVEPEIFPDNEVSIKVMLEVSNIAKEIVGDNGLRAYQIGTRTASTTLQLADGETQILAGLIKNEEIVSESRVPGLGAIPGIGRLFSNENNNNRQSELVLLITPRIVRNVPPANSVDSIFYSGTRDRLSLAAPNLGAQAVYRTEPSTPLTASQENITVADTSSGAPAPTQPTAAPSSDTPHLITAPVNLLAPRGVKGGQSFNASISIAADQPPLQSVMLHYDPLVLTSDGVVPQGQVGAPKMYASEGVIRFDFEGASPIKAGQLLPTIAFTTRIPDNALNTSLRLETQAVGGQQLDEISHTLRVSAPLNEGPEDPYLTNEPAVTQ
ncbi:secretin N-terminal domain-containing protein [Halopseudomonas sabulinigri]|uniref:Secretin/TonB short N-terminal domain-containing protein n=1 Tax=Halopseudomonas sabulinigri TaxID=472181 RepID=A0ABP9ZUS8_9GAMM